MPGTTNWPRRENLSPATASNICNSYRPGLLRSPGIWCPALGASSIEFLPGWRSGELSLADALLLARDRDREAGHTTVGPHRADWRIDYAGHPQPRSPLARPGQALRPVGPAGPG